MHFKHGCTSRVTVLFGLGGWEIDFNIPVVNMDVMKRETRSGREQLHTKQQKNAINIFTSIKLIKTE